MFLPLSMRMSTSQVQIVEVLNRVLNNKPALSTLAFKLISFICFSSACLSVAPMLHLRRTIGSSSDGLTMGSIIGVWIIFGGPLGSGVGLKYTNNICLKHSYWLISQTMRGTIHLFNMFNHIIHQKHGTWYKILLEEKK